MADHQDAVWPPWGCGWSPGPRLAAMEAWRSPGLCVLSWGRRRGPSPSGRHGSVDILWAPSGCRGGVVDILGPVWSPWGRGRFAGSHMAVVAVWAVSWASSCHHWGVADLLGPVWLLLGGPVICCHLGIVWPPGRRGRPTGPRLVAVGSWSVPWVPTSGRGCVDRFLSLVPPPWERGLSNVPRMVARGRVPSPSPRQAAVGAWFVSWALSGRREKVARPMWPVWRLWGRGLFPGPSLGALGAWLMILVPSRLLGGVAGPGIPSGSRCCMAGPLGPSGHRWVVACPLGTVWPL